MDDNIKIDPADKKCAPAKIFESGSCISLDVLLEMAAAYNADQGNPSNKIRLYSHLDTLNPKKYKAYLLHQFDKKLSGVCDNQKCWTKQGFINKMKKSSQDELSKYTFRPEGPEGKFDWLNTLNINDSMKQYEKKYPEFKFLGAVPMDFDELPALGISNLNFDKLKKTGKTKIGVVFNLDEHYKSGSHWVAMYSDLQDGKIYYYDSYAVRPEQRVRKFMRRISRYCQESGIRKPITDYNKIRHQRGDNACGVYSMTFILRLLNGETFEQICESRPTDDEVNKCRKVFFS